MDLHTIDRINKERFWKKVNKTDSCWLWTGNKNCFGYGIVTLVIGGRKSLRAHRVSWVIANGRELSQSDFVCHSCDVPACVNPDHLWIGDAKSNNQDCIQKGRNASPPVKKTYAFCKKGHELSQSNRYEYVYNGVNYRICRECAIVKAKARKHRIKMEKLKCNSLWV